MTASTFAERMAEYDHQYEQAMRDLDQLHAENTQLRTDVDRLYRWFAGLKRQTDGLDERTVQSHAIGSRGPWRVGDRWIA